MPMRDALEKFLEEFHDEKWALTMDEIRLELGLEGAVVFDNTAVPYPRDLIIVGHNFVGDMKILDLFNVDLYQFFDHIGVADTQVLVEDTADESLPQSLAGLVLMYKLYEAQKSGKAKGGFVFRDQHNAGNDAVANLKAFLRMATDSLFGTSSYTYDDEGDDEYMADVVSKTIDIKLDKPLAFRNPNLVMMCFDAEGVKQNASEFGFAWILASEIRDVPPGDDCQNWWPYVRAKHFLREKHTQHSRRYTDGNPWGFWKEFGQTERYSPNQGTTPFDRMLNEIIKQSSTSSTTQVVASDDAAPVVPPSPRKPTALAPHLRSPASTSQVVLSDDTAPVLAPHLRALAPHLRSPASTSQVVVSDDTAPVLPPHLRALHKPISATQVITSDETTPVLPPHLRVLPPHLRALHKPVSATQVVVSDDTAPVLPPHLRVLPPHLRALHKPASATRVAASDDAVPSLSPHLRNLDINQVEAARDQERQAMERRSIMQRTCLDNLIFGKPCRTEKDCKDCFKICPDYKRSPEYCNLPFMHELGDDTVVHIKATCVNVNRDRPCPRQPECPFGHDFETLRKALNQRRLRVARRNLIRHGWRTHQARVREESMQQGGGNLK